ncbi:MAG: radical SAM protein [Candidatus Omnitrophota bacterium]|nr:MAG: radical SAM protein [Candidatus Omnitrophota bacterium]
MPRIQPNANFHTVTEKTVLDDRKDKEFLEYRRRWYEFPINFIVGGFPIHLDIETTNICNLHCPFCATTFKNWGPYKKGLLDLSLFKRIIDEGADNGLCSVKLSLRGEPLLHPDIAEMVAYAKKRGIIDIYFNTNGTFLDENKINQLIDSGLDRISISFEGISKEVYQRYRPGAEYESVVDNIKKLRQIRDKRNLPHPKIRIQTVLLPELREAFTEYVGFWEKIADEVSYLDARKETPKDKHKGGIADWACPFLWQRMVILWDGTILPCLMHGVDNFSLMSLGNVKELSIKEMWQGKEVFRYREIHRLGQSHKLEACERCSYRAMELEKLEIKK